MGEVKKVYCDACGLQAGTESYSTPSGSGPVIKRVKLYRQEGSTEQVDFSGDLCVDCYDKILLWIKDLKTASDSENTLDVIPTLVTTPEI